MNKRFLSSIKCSTNVWQTMCSQTFVRYGCNLKELLSEKVKESNKTKKKNVKVCQKKKKQNQYFKKPR
jgi:uncharacterized protein YifE (UPF0438 family)